MAKEPNIDMKVIAKELGTTPKKSKYGAGSYIKYNLPTIKGEMHYDGSGGLYFKPKQLGLDCYIDNGKILDQIKEVELRIAAYISLKADLKRIKKAVLKGTHKIPERKNDLGSTQTSAVVSRSSRRKAKAENSKG